MCLAWLSASSHALGSDTSDQTAPEIQFSATFLAYLGSLIPDLDLTDLQLETTEVTTAVTDTSANQFTTVTNTNIATAANGPEIASPADGPEIASPANQAASKTDTDAPLSPAKSDLDDDDYNPMDEDYEDEDEDYEYKSRKKKTVNTSSEVKTGVRALFEKRVLNDNDIQAIYDFYGITWEMLSNTINFNAWCKRKILKLQEINNLRALRRKIKNRTYAQKRRDRARAQDSFMNHQKNSSDKGPGSNQGSGSSMGVFLGMATAAMF